MSNFFDDVSYDIPFGNELIHDKNVNFISQNKIIDLVSDLEIIFGKLSNNINGSIDLLNNFIVLS